MSEKFTKEDIKKAIEQADANMGFEEVIIPNLTKKEDKQNKILRKSFTNGQTRSN